MPPTIFLLLGFPGVGKYTTAKELVRLLENQGQPVRLMDNHRVANILFALIAEADGSTPLPAGIFPRIREINMVVLHTIRELSPRHWSFVFTHYLTNSSASRAYVDEIRELADLKSLTFIPVVLSAEADEHLRRVPSRERQIMSKLTDPGIAHDLLKSDDILVPYDAIHIDVTNSTPMETALSILKNASRRLFVT